MSSDKPDQTEMLMRFSRRQLWFLLVGALLLAVATVIDIAFPGVALPSSVGVPLGIIVFVFVLYPSSKGIRWSRSNPAMKAIENDELRQVAQAKAFRNGFFAMLAVQPVVPLLLTWLSVPNSLGFMSAASAWTGGVVFLASFLYFDR
jgi:hypothetical protein